MSQETYEFSNCRGEKVFFPATATMEDLVRAGVDEIRLVPKNSPPDTDPKWFAEECLHHVIQAESRTPTTNSSAFHTPAPDAC